MAAIVTARPSMLSRRLNAFVIPTSQRTAIAVARTSFPTICTWRPAATTRAAAATEEGRLPLVPAVAARLGDDTAAERGADQRPGGEGGGRQREGGERGGHTGFEG